jgi:uncharacterized membrane protein
MADNSTGLQENIASALCYVFGWVSGLVFYLIDSRKTVRFHALQSILVYVALMIIYIIFWFIPVIGWLINVLVGIAAFILWIMLILKAYQGQTWKLPVIGNMAEKWANK